MRKVKHCDRGFTLIEVLVAMTILAIGLLSIATMQITAMRANTSANTLSVASSLAQGVMEELMARENDDPLFSVDAADITWDLDPGDAGETDLTINGAGTYSATCTIDADNPVNNVARIDVLVTNGVRTVTLTGFKGNMNIRFRNNQSAKGFTLVELLVVVAITGLVVTAIFAMHSSSVRSVSTQDEVVELQQNLRIALGQMARDIRMAGFMVPSAQTALSAATATSMTLRLGTVTGQAARIDAAFTSPSAAGTERNVAVASAEMVDMFDSGQYVRIIRPQDGSQPLDRVFEVASKDRTVPQLVLKGFNSAREYLSGDILVRVLDGDSTDTDPNTNPPAYPATVTYALVDDPDSADPAMLLLQRTATGLAAETVALNVTAIAFSYLLEDGTESAAPADLADIRAVRITLTGATDANELAAHYSGVITRQVTSVVKIRNI